MVANVHGRRAGDQAGHACGRSPRERTQAIAAMLSWPVQRQRGDHEQHRRIPALGRARAVRGGGHPARLRRHHRRHGRRAAHRQDPAGDPGAARRARPEPGRGRLPALHGADGRHARRRLHRPGRRRLRPAPQRAARPGRARGRQPRRRVGDPAGRAARAARDRGLRLPALRTARAQPDPPARAAQPAGTAPRPVGHLHGHRHLAGARRRTAADGGDRLAGTLGGVGDGVGGGGRLAVPARAFRPGAPCDGGDAGGGRRPGARNGGRACVPRSAAWGRGGSRSPSRCIRASGWR